MKQNKGSKTERNSKISSSKIDLESENHSVLSNFTEIGINLNVCILFLKSLTISRNSLFINKWSK